MYPFPKNKDLLWPSWVLASPFGLFFRPLWVSLGGGGSQRPVSLPSEYSQVFVMATGFLLATCCSDPGIIPRREAGFGRETEKRSVTDSVGFFFGCLEIGFLGAYLQEGVRYVMLYHIMLCYVISYHIISCYTILSQMFCVPSIQPTLKYCKSRAFRKTLINNTPNHLTINRKNQKNRYLQPMDHLKPHNSGKR